MGNILESFTSSCGQLDDHWLFVCIKRTGWELKVVFLTDLLENVLEWCFPKSHKPQLYGDKTPLLSTVHPVCPQPPRMLFTLILSFWEAGDIGIMYGSGYVFRSCVKVSVCHCCWAYWCDLVMQLRTIYFHLFFTNMVFVKSFSDFGFDGTGFCLKTHITYYVEHLCAAVPFSPSLFFTGCKPATIQLWQLFKNKNNNNKKTQPLRM